MAKSSNYWLKRFETIEATANAYGQEAYRQIEPAFNQAQRQIQAEIDAWVSRVAQNNQVSLTEARRLLNAKELAEFKWDVNEFIKYGTENAIDPVWMKQLENASARYHVSRLEAMQIRTQQQFERAFGNQLDITDTMARRVFTDTYYQSAFEIQRGFNVGWDIVRIDERRLDRFISKPWAADGKNFSDRIWQAKTSMVNDLHNELVRMCILGKSPDEAIKNMAKYVDKKVGNAKHRAGALVMTEQAFFSSAAQKECFNELDVEEYEIVATLDSSTSEICQELDGQHFPMKDFQPGVTAPPFHVRCRSTTAPWFEDNYGGERAARDEDGNTYYVPDDMTYKDWQERFVDGGSKDGMVSALTDKEHKAVLDYISAKSYTLNDKLRAGIPLSGDEKEMAENLSRALQKLPIYEGTVYRSVSDFGIDDVDEFIRAYVPGQTRVAPSFTSSGVEIYDKSFPIQYIITSRQGRDFRVFNPTEHEILFDMNTIFEVKKVEGNIIFMTEV